MSYQNICPFYQLYFTTTVDYSHLDLCSAILYFNVLFYIFPSEAVVRNFRTTEVSSGSPFSKIRLIYSLISDIVPE